MAFVYGANTLKGILMAFSHFSLNCRGRLLTFDEPRVMGILNVTPDSFYAGSRVSTPSEVASLAGQMLAEGADVLDVGGMSSRPGAVLISEQQELDRVLPAIEAIVQNHPDAIISIDTVRARVAEAAIAAGASIINDISAGSLDAAMYETAARLGAPYILMHMKGRPETMQQEAVYEDVIAEVFDFLAVELAKLRALGVKDVVVDPGFGFGKTIDHNFQLLKKLHVFQALDVPVLAGISRKSMIYRTLGVGPEDALNGASALHMVALQQGAQLLRVHDVAPARQVIALWKRMTTTA
jgi:dihydropteroate synthase